MSESEVSVLTASSVSFRRIHPHVSCSDFKLPVFCVLSLRLDFPVRSTCPFLVFPPLCI